MIVVDLVRIAATRRRIRLMTRGKRCCECGGRFTSPGCCVGPGRKPTHSVHGGIGQGAA